MPHILNAHSRAEHTVPAVLVSGGEPCGSNTLFGYGMADGDRVNSRNAFRTPTECRESHMHNRRVFGCLQGSVLQRSDTLGSLPARDWWEKRSEGECESVRVEVEREGGWS